MPAFPGAEGAGALTPGGRGGRVIAVTNLQDAGPGSFRAAVEAAGPRIVVFRVAGLITLQSPVVITHPFLTVAGQTAPGDGICIRGDTTTINASDVVIRHLRFRRGNLESRDDALNAVHSPGRIILDHCSFSWGLDENVSLYRYMRPTGEPDRFEKRPIENVTIQWCISSEALDLNHHAFGGTWGGRNVSFHHNLFASNTGRNPSIGWGDHVDFRNNVLFNWRHRTIDGGDATSVVNIVANYLKAGPATQSGAMQHQICKPEPIRNFHERPEPGRWFVAENFVFGHPEVTKDNWNGGVRLPRDQAAVAAFVERSRREGPGAAAPIAQQTAEQACELVLERAGATRPRRDAVDARIVAEVRSGRPQFGESGIIRTPDDVGGWPAYRGVPAPVDSDHDGMPDAWERRHAFEPHDPADGIADPDRDGYTNVEEFLNGTDPHEFIDYTIPANNVDTLS